MTFDQIVARIMDRLNLTSADASVRVGENVNDRYHQVCSSIGLEQVRIGKSTITVNTTNYPNLPELSITDYDKLSKVAYINGTAIRVLKEMTYDEITSVPTNSTTPQNYAIKSYGAHSLVLVLDGYLPSSGFTLQLQGYTRLTDINGVTEPIFPEDFHDILVQGGMSDELRKMEKPQLAMEREAKFEQRLSDLRMFIAKSAYLDIAQGKDKPGATWYRPWFSRISMN
jgi:hypothetical protein